MLVSALELFKELGIDFVSFQESIDTTTSMGRLFCADLIDTFPGTAPYGQPTLSLRSEN